MLKKDSIGLGIILGFFAPLFGLFIYYFAKFSLFSFKEFLEVVLSQKSLLTAMLSIALVANAAIFTYFINYKIDNTAKGIFISTCIYAVFVLFWKFIS